MSTTHGAKEERPVDFVLNLGGGLHPVQMKALTILSERVASPKEIAIELGLTKAKAGFVSHHVKQLRKRGLVDLVRTAPVRGVKEHFYKASVPFAISDDDASRMTLAERLAVSSWVISLMHRDLLTALESGSIDERTDRHLTRSPLHLDEEAIEDLITEHNQAYFKTQEIQAESDERCAISGEIPRPVAAILAAFLMPIGSGDPNPPLRPQSTLELPAPNSTEAVRSTARTLRSGWHPIQMQALTILSERVASPKEIAIEIGLTKAKAGLVSYHVKELLKRGQVELVHMKPVRGANEHFYRASTPFILVGEATEEMTLQERLIVSCWTISCMTRDFAQSIDTGAFDERPDRHLTRSPLHLDERGFKDLVETHNRLFYRGQQIQRESQQRGASDQVRTLISVVASVPMPR